MKNIRKENNPVYLLPLAIVAISTAAIFIRFAQRSLPSITIATYRMVFAALLLMPFSIKKAVRELHGVSFSTIVLLLLSGMSLAVHFASWIISLDKTNVLSSVVLVTTTPIWVTALSPLFFKDKISRRFWIGLIVSFIGIVIVSGLNPSVLVDTLSPFDNTYSLEKIDGNLLALLGAFCAAAYVTIGRVVRNNISTQTYTFTVYSTAAFLLVAYTSLFTEFSLTFEANDFIWLILLALIPQLIGHSLINKFLGIYPAHTVSIFLLGEPVGATILAILFLNEFPAIYEIFGGLIIISGIVIAITNNLINFKNKSQGNQSP